MINPTVGFRDLGGGRPESKSDILCSKCTEGCGGCGGGSPIYDNFLDAISYLNMGGWGPSCLFFEHIYVATKLPVSPKLKT